MKILVTAYIATFVAFVVLDFIWLSKMSGSVYRPIMGDMVLDSFRIPPAVVFYLAYAAGLVFLAVRPALATGDWTTALVYGAVTGAMAYGTYDLTNQATLKNWSTTLTVVDMGWGTVLSGLAASAGYAASRWMQGV